MLYDGWYGLVRVVIVGGCAYFALIALLRISGKRTLAKLNAFDLVGALVLETDGSFALVTDPTAPTLPDQRSGTSPAP